MSDKRPVLRRGARGASVADLQSALGCSPIDGVYGAATEDRVRALQLANGLAADGIVGESTWLLVDKRPVPIRPEADASATTNVFMVPHASQGVVVTLAMLRAVAPRTPQSLLESLTGPMTACCRLFDIDTPVRLAAFLSQCAHESAQFKAREESLTYSTADRIQKTWPKRFPTAASAQPYVRSGEKLANKVYAGRMGNGPPGSGDGWRFRGRGFKQVTGRENYTALAKVLKKPLEAMPDYMMTADGACVSAGWFWSKNRLNRYADVRDIRTLTFKINGGYIGLDQRMALFGAACKACGI